MFVPEVAEQFQKANMTALIYDPRSLGLSDGEPRNEVDPIKQISDYSDALTYLTTLPIVDKDAIFFWGQSFAGCVALCAAALDKRAKACISICPLLDFSLTPTTFPRILSKSMKDRESRVAGNDPMYLPVLTADGRNPAGSESVLTRRNLTTWLMQRNTEPFVTRIGQLCRLTTSSLCGNSWDNETHGYAGTPFSVFG